MLYLYLKYKNYAVVAIFWLKIYAYKIILFIYCTVA